MSAVASVLKLNCAKKKTCCAPPSPRPILSWPSSPLTEPFWRPIAPRWKELDFNEVKPSVTKSGTSGVADAAKGSVVREECRYALRDGSVRIADRTLNPLQDERGEVVMIVASSLDITEHLQLRGILEDRVRERTLELEVKNAEVVRQTEIVRELSARLLQIQDEERRRIARELHDSVGQMLAAVSMNMANVHREAEALSPEAAKSLEDNTGLLEQLSIEIRTISHLLHPPLLDEVGLESALQWYIDGFSERSKINVDLQLPEDFGR